MQTTGKIIFDNLPQVKNFSFLISGISVFDLNPISFNFYDTGNNSFSFYLESGLITTNRIIYLYNTKESINIEGHVKDNKLYYKINDVAHDKQINFSSLSKLKINSFSESVVYDIFINSNPINYSFEVNPSYSLGGILSGKINTDTTFYIKDYSLVFKNSDIQLFSGQNNLTGIFSKGQNAFGLKDIDNLKLEYKNSFLIYFDTIFGSLKADLYSYRGDYYNNKIFSLSENSFNLYNKSFLFDGIVSGNNFYHVKNKENFNLTYSIGTFDYLGGDFPSLVSVKFEPVYPLNNSYYTSEYVTGFSLTNQGLYSGLPPSAEFIRYYYVDGISQYVQNLLFSQDCPNQIQITYSGKATGQASGYLDARDVYISGLYGNGINKYKAIFNYIPYSYGSGYTGAPIILWGTGGNCFSLADVSGEKGQFKKIHNTYAKIVSHADYLTGTVLTSGITGNNGIITGYKVTGLQLTNIGSGYTQIFPPKVYFIRSTEDILNQDASGILNYKKSGLYNFPASWSINYNFSGYLLENSSFIGVNQNEIQLIDNNYFSGNILIPSGEKLIYFDLNCSGLDNTVPLSSLITLNIGEDSNKIITQNYIYNDKYYNTNTGALI